MKKALFLVLVGFLTLISQVESVAQCAMCRATVSSNLSEGRGVIGTGINDGILYLLVITYVSVPTIIYFWFKEARKEQRRRELMQNISLN